MSRRKALVIAGIAMACTLFVLGAVAQLTDHRTISTVLLCTAVLVAGPAYWASTDLRKEGRGR